MARKKRSVATQQKNQQQRKRKRQLNSRTPFRQGLSPYALKHRAGRLAEIITEYPEQIALGLASRDDASWIFGRLYLVGVLSIEQKIAAERLSKVVSTYRRLIHRYPGAKLSNVNGVGTGGGTHEEDLSPRIERVLQRAQEEYNKGLDILRSCSPEIEAAVLRALETDKLTDLDSIQRGLDALSNGAVSKSMPG